jgi:hypothetical protein
MPLAVDVDRVLASPERQTISSAQEAAFSLSREVHRHSSAATSSSRSSAAGTSGSWFRYCHSASPFFAFCLLLVIIWLVQGVTLIVSKGSLNAFLDSQYQLEINTTTIVTFLMVALLQNSQTRTDQARQHKLNALADGLADLMEHLASQFPDSSLDKDMQELRAAIGLETKEGTSGNAR